MKWKHVIQDDSPESDPYGRMAPPRGLNAADRWEEYLEYETEEIDRALEKADRNFTHWGRS